MVIDNDDVACLGFGAGLVDKAVLDARAVAAEAVFRGARHIGPGRRIVRHPVTAGSVPGFIRFGKKSDLLKVPDGCR